MNTNFYNKDGSLTAYAFCCGYIQRIAWDNGVENNKYGDVEVDLTVANMSISLWDIKVSIGDWRKEDYYHCWMQCTGLKNARKCWARAKAIAKKFSIGKLSKEETQRQIDALASSTEEQDTSKNKDTDEFNTIIDAKGNDANRVELRTDSKNNRFNVLARLAGSVKHNETYTSQAFAFMIFTAFTNWLGLDSM